MSSMRAIGLVCLVTVLGGCMANAFAVKFSQEKKRFMFNDERLGAKAQEVLTRAEANYAQEPACTIQKTGAVVVKKAASVQTCDFSSLQDVVLAEQKVLSARYTFINGYFEQLDLEIEEVTEKSKDALLNELTASFDVDLEIEGPLSRWSGVNDVAMLIRQGNYKFRMINRLYLPENTDYNRLSVRQ